VSAFETWFGNLRGSYVHPAVSHAFGGQLRGLAWNDEPPPPSSTGRTKIATIPSRAVLTSDYTKESWDADLAVALWKECEEGGASAYAGYCRLLMTTCSDVTGSKVPPPSTAPDAVRHWTDQEKDVLVQSGPIGRNLLELEKKQRESWRRKFQQRVDEGKGMSYEQFCWAMEAVHSRAFCGVQLAAAPSILPLAAPIVATAVGWLYATTVEPASAAVLTACAVGAVAPTFLLLHNKPTSACLLPLVDSANHLDEADSTIEYDPISRSFELTIGPKCLVTTDNEDDRTTQIYVSYGRKSSAEWLLNYGFLPGVVVKKECRSSMKDYRRALAEEFVMRQ
jgi:hypothetical protein